MNENNIGNKYYLGWNTYGVFAGIDDENRPYFSIEDNLAKFGRDSDGYYHFTPEAFETMVPINSFKFLKSE